MLKTGTLIGCMAAIWFWTTTVSALQVPVMVENNLFNPERKPVSSEATAPVKQNQRKIKALEKAFQLDAVFYFGEVKSALLRVNSRILRTQQNKTASPYVRVHEKDAVGDYQVVAIEPTSVTIQGNGETLNIPLFQQGKISPPAVPLPAAPAQEQPKAGAAEEQPQAKQPAAAKTPPVPLINKKYAKPAQINSWRAKGSRAARSNPAPAPAPSDANVNDTIDELRRAIETLQQGSNQP